MKLLKWFLVGLCVFGLVAVRMVETQLFYDPFQQFFHLANKNAPFPNFDWLPLIGNYIFRFLLNLIFSTAIVYIIFRNKKWTFQAIILMILGFLITFPLYLYSIYTEFEIGYLFSFYMRRFVIQPLILLLIVPLFYYRQHLKDTNL